MEHILDMILDVAVMLQQVGNGRIEIGRLLFNFLIIHFYTKVRQNAGREEYCTIIYVFFQQFVG